MTGHDDDLRRLLKRFRAGDDAGARRFYSRLAPGLRLYARSLLRDEALADDAVQGAFLRALRAPRRRVRAVNDPRAWMASIVRSEALTLLRTRRRAAGRDGRAALERDAFDDERSPVDPALARAVADLPDDMREVVMLKHLCGLTFDQIALVLDENRNTLAARHRRAVARLRETLASGAEDFSQEATRHAPHT